MLADNLLQHIAHVRAVDRPEADVQSSSVVRRAENIDYAIRPAAGLDERVVCVVKGGRRLDVFNGIELQLEGAGAVAVEAQPTHC